MRNSWNFITVANTERVFLIEKIYREYMNSMLIFDKNKPKLCINISKYSVINLDVALGQDGRVCWWNLPQDVKTKIPINCGEGKLVPHWWVAMKGLLRQFSYWNVECVQKNLIKGTQCKRHFWDNCHISCTICCKVLAEDCV